MKLLITILFVLSCSYSFAQVGAMSFSVMEDSTEKEIPFAIIKIYKDNTLIQEIIGDSTGGFKIENLKPDTVDVVCEAKFYHPKRKTIAIIEGKIHLFDFYLKSIKD